MKWGHRNGPPYPLKDGAHSKAEQKADPSLAKRAAKAAGNIANAVIRGNGHAHYGRNPRRLSDEELKQRIERLKREAEYEQLLGVKTRQQRQEIKIARGKKFAENLGQSIGAQLGQRIGKLGTGIGDVGRSASKQLFTDVASLPGIVLKDVAEVPGILVKDIASVPGSLIGLGKDAASQAIKNAKVKESKYDAKLSAARSKKAYEDWMSENDPIYARALARQQQKDRMDYAAKKYSKQLKSMNRMLGREERRREREQEREYRKIGAATIKQIREAQRNAIDNGRDLYSAMPGTDIPFGVLGEGILNMYDRK